MINVDSPAFPVALLAILSGLRLALYAADRSLERRTRKPAPELSPDDAEGGAPAPLKAEEAPAPAPTAPSAVENGRDFLAELLDAGIIAVVLVFFLIRPFILQAFHIPSESMVPTLRMGDSVLATKYTYRMREPHRGEVVVFRAPRAAQALLGKPYDPKRPTDYVKRVIGLPGDRIRVVRGKGVFVNDNLLEEPTRPLPDYDFPLSDYGALAVDRSVAPQLAPNVRGGKVIVPGGYLFVLGDNRTRSHDSHKWGLLERRRLVGKAVFIFWPLSRMGVVR